MTNQITTHVSHDLGRQSDWSDELDEDLQGDGSVVTAALGNAWSHCVNTRLLLQYMQGGKRMVRAGREENGTCRGVRAGREENGGCKRTKGWRRCECGRSDVGSVWSRGCV